MFHCDKCDAKFPAKRSLLQHIRSLHENIRFACVQCSASFTRKTNLNKHIEKVHGLPPGTSDTPQGISLPNPLTPAESDPNTLTHSPPTSNQSRKRRHSGGDSATPVKRPSPFPEPRDEWEEVEALDDAVFAARATPSGVETDASRLINSHTEAIYGYIEKKRESKKGVKWYLVIRARYTRSLANIDTVVEALPYFRGFTYATLSSDVIRDQISTCIQKIEQSMSEYEDKGSGWVLDRIEFLQLNIIAYSPLQGGSYIELPQWIADKKAVINIKNDDDRCFLYCILAQLHPTNIHPERVNKYTEFAEELNLEGISFPFKYDSNKLKKFENANNLSINIFAVEKIIFPIHVSENKVKAERQIDLLLLTCGKKQHYCLIRSLSRLLSDLTKDCRSTFYCRYCLHRFSGANAKNNHSKHVKDCNVHGPQRIEMPTENPICRFTKFGWCMRVPYVIYADFESIMPKVDTCLPDSTLSSTTTLAHHISCGFSYVVVGPGGKASKPVTYRGKDATKVFFDKLDVEAKTIQGKIAEKLPLNLSSEEEKTHREASTCYLCDKPFTSKDWKVRDHDHYLGMYRGAAHNTCNLKLKPPNHIPVFLHNLSRYDGHLLMQQIGLIKNKRIDCIPSNSETYISFSLGHLRFVDSFRFLAAPLETLVGNLAKGGSDKFPILNSVYNPDEVALLLRKGVYPYDLMDSTEQFNREQLPSKDSFFNILTDTPINDNDYEHAQKVWETFRIRNMGEYHDLYVTADTLQLADVFESFRNICMNYYKLDSAHSYTSPGFAWESALYMTGVELDLLLDPDMHLMIERGIRGGVSMITHRLATANNNLFPDTYDPEKPTTFLTYLDCNNLYGTVMMDPMPMREFQWSNSIPIEDILKHPDDDKIGYILEVDLTYPASLHHDHNDLPLAPQKRSVVTSELSNYTKKQLEHLNIPLRDSLPKLIPDLHPKTNYVVHYRNLRYYVEKGMKISRVHRILSFEQGTWLSEYIAFNTEKRKMAANDFEKDFFKLMNNAVFGKTMENLRNRIKFDLVQHPKLAIKKASSPTFEKFTIFHNDLVGIHSIRKSITLNRPIYTGFTILDLSKLLMYRFHYDTIRAQYNDKAKLLFTDTDSLTYYIETNDLYKDLAQKAHHYDFSGYPTDHPLFSNENKKSLGKFKDELNGLPIQEFCGLRPKMYSILSANGEKKTAKGICKRVVRKSVFHADYRDCLLNRKITTAEMNRIVSAKHNLYTIRQNKLCLNPCDDKRYILEDGITTLAHGHVDIPT